MLERRAGRRQDLDQMRFAFDPGIRNRQGGASKMFQHRPIRRGECPVGVVNDHLRDRDRVGAVVEHGKHDAVRAELRPIDREPLNRRDGASAKAVAGIGLDDDGNEHGKERERRESREPQTEEPTH